MTIIDKLTKKKWPADQVLLLAGFLLLVLILLANERSEERYRKCMETAAGYALVNEAMAGCAQPDADLAHTLCSDASGY